MNKMMHLEQRCSLSLLVSTNLKVLAPLDWVLRHVFACLALQPQHNFLGCLCLLVKHWLCLTSITRLLAIITTFTLSSKAILPLFVLSDLVQGVLFALLVLAVGLLCLRNVHLYAHVAFLNFMS